VHGLKRQTFEAVRPSGTASFFPIYTYLVVISCFGDPYPIFELALT
jgi:hypothetical protein